VWTATGDNEGGAARDGDDDRFGRKDLGSFWPDVLDLVRQRTQQQTFDTWFRPLRPDDHGREGAYRVFCPSSFYLDFFSQHHLDTLNEAGSSFFGRAVRFQLAVDPQRPSHVEIFRPDTAEIAEPVPGRPAARVQDLPRERQRSAVLGDRLDDDAPPASQLNADYTFENFVVGNGTNLAFAAATAVAKMPGKHYNPLFIHGGVGLGKTHLLHAIGNEVRRTFPHKRICYVTAEQFMSDLVFAIQQHKQPEFKLRYRSNDVLLVDDVAFWAGKESTQEEFFHTFNTLYNHKKLIVLTSDRSPKEISNMEVRLRTRFEWGLIVDIQPPNLETRIAILKRKVEINNIYIHDDVIQYIAENITDNIRRLEGALIRLLAFASLTAKDITLEMASEVLSSFFQSDSTGPIKILDVQKAVCAESGYSMDQLKSKRRTQDLALWRQCAMYLARELTGASLNQIGRAFGGKDHSTVAHACHKVQGLCAADPSFRGRLMAIIDKLRRKR
jgi:chromosomal replication initiator protein